MVVQSADSWAETEYLLSLAARTSWIGAVVGWVPLLDPHACEEALQLGAGSLAGVRHLVHTEADPDWLTRPAVTESLRLLAASGVVFEIPAEFPLHLGHVPGLADAVPSLTIVIDHLAKPPVASGAVEPWARAFRCAARRPNVHAKISGLNSAARPHDWGADDLRPFVDVALDALGPDRLMFGSDWPVLLVNADYTRVLDATRDVLGQLSSDEQVRIFDRNARMLYAVGHPTRHREEQG